MLAFSHLFMYQMVTKMMMTTAAVTTIIVGMTTSGIETSQLAPA